MNQEKQGSPCLDSFHLGPAKKNTGSQGLVKVNKGPIINNCRIDHLHSLKLTPGIPTTMKTMGVNITTIAYLGVLIIEIGSTIILMVVEAQGNIAPENGPSEKEIHLPTIDLFSGHVRWSGREPT